jgi:hypothetical protein
LILFLALAFFPGLVFAENPVTINVSSWSATLSRADNSPAVLNSAYFKQIGRELDIFILDPAEDFHKICDLMRPSFGVHLVTPVKAGIFNVGVPGGEAALEFRIPARDNPNQSLSLWSVGSDANPHTGRIKIDSISANSVQGSLMASGQANFTFLDTEITYSATALGEFTALPCP